MGGQDSWKRTEDIEIDLADLIRKICMQWRKIAVCALIFAAVLGIYGQAGNRGGSKINEADMLQEKELSEAEEQAVEEAVRLKEEIRELEIYLENSVLMQLDPYHKARYIMLYSVEQADRRKLPQITESYLNFIQNGGAADALIKSESRWKMDKSYLSEVISSYQKTYNMPYQVVAGSSADEGETAASFFYAELTGRDMKEVKSMALDLQDVLEGYSDEVSTIAGSHRLKLLNSTESIIFDSVLQAQQHDKKALLSSNQAALRTVKDGFTEKQMAVYKKMTGEDGEFEEEQDSQEEAVLHENPLSVMKYMLFGFVAGILGYGCVFSLWYLFCDEVRNTEELKRMYTFPIYGEICLAERKGKRAAEIFGVHKDAYGQTAEQIWNRIRMSCEKQNVSKLCAVSDFSFTESEKKCLQNMAEQLKESGIEMKIAENICSDTAVWDNLMEIGNVLLICRMGTTTHSMIDCSMNFYLEKGIAVTGAAVFLQNE